MKQYLDLLSCVLERGCPRKDRTGVGVRSLFGWQLRCDLDRGFPLLTTKAIHFKSVVYELLWFIRGDTSVRYLNERGVTIWDAWADGRGDLGPIYGRQWRAWGVGDGTSIDQLRNVIAEIHDNPRSRRLLVSAWNAGELSRMRLPPCHVMFQFYVADGKLSCQLYQRSADVFLGVPFNIASYSLLTMMIARVCGLRPGEFIHTFGDVHLYENHIEQASEQLRRKPGPLPTVRLNSEVKDLFQFDYDDVILCGYDAQPHIPAPVAV